MTVFKDPNVCGRNKNKGNTKGVKHSNTSSTDIAIPPTLYICNTVVYLEIFHGGPDNFPNNLLWKTTIFIYYYVQIKS